MINGFRKPMQIKQGLKILAYGEDGAGKSLFALSFPKIGIVDTESKLGVYENNSNTNKNIVGIVDTAQYYEVIELSEKVIDNNKEFNTFVIDSETNLYESMQVAMMEVEENRARKKGGNVDDQAVSQRGWGKVKLNNARLKSLKAQMSAKGITVISIAHKEDVFQEINNKQIKIGERPALRKNSKHDYDIVLRFFKEKDIASGKTKLMVEVEKDTTLTYEVGHKDSVENINYNSFKKYIEENEKAQTSNADYGKSISDTIDKASEEAQSFDDLTKEFENLFKKLGSIDESNKIKVKKLLDTEGIDTYKNPEHFEKLKKIVTVMTQMEKNI